MTILCNKGLLEGRTSSFSIISYGSRKLHRMACSSTSAEVQECGNSLDTHEFLKHLLLEIHQPDGLDLRNFDELLRQTPSAIVCDAKNMFDALNIVQSAGLHLEEKRTAVECLAIRQRLRAAGISLRWVDSDQEVADGFTKPFAFEQILRALRLGKWTIVFDPRFVSAKKKRKMIQSQKKGQTQP